jgi:hypothetical protein
LVARRPWPFTLFIALGVAPVQTSAKVGIL